MIPSEAKDIVAMLIEASAHGNLAWEPHDSDWPYEPADTFIVNFPDSSFVVGRSGLGISATIVNDEGRAVWYFYCERADPDFPTMAQLHRLAEQNATDVSADLKRMRDSLGKILTRT